MVFIHAAKDSAEKAVSGDWESEDQWHMAVITLWWAAAAAGVSKKTLDYWYAEPVRLFHAAKGECIRYEG